MAPSAPGDPQFGHSSASAAPHGTAPSAADSPLIPTDAFPSGPALEGSFVPLPTFEETQKHAAETIQQSPKAAASPARTGDKPAKRSPARRITPSSKQSAKQSITGQPARGILPAWQSLRGIFRENIAQPIAQQWSQRLAPAIEPAIAPIMAPIMAPINAQINVKQRQQLHSLWAAARPVLLTTLVMASGLTLLRQGGAFQSLELGAYDLMIRQRPSPGPDPRLLIVGITELDTRRLKRWPLTDEIYAEALAKLQAHGPRAIGLDIYRDFPQPPGTEGLYQQQFTQPNVIAIRKMPNQLDPTGVPAPPITEAQIGFNDVVLDPDTSLRRALLLTFDEAETLQYSLGYRLAELYLRAEGIEGEYIPETDWNFMLGQARIAPLNSHSGGYQSVQDGGIQVLLNYRAAIAEQVAPTVSLSDVLDGKVPPELIQDKIVVIGTTAPSHKDMFVTPFIKLRKGGLDMPGVVVHAQIVSQLVDGALGDRPLFSFWPEWLEIAWLFGCVGLGATLTTLMRHPMKLLAAQVGGVTLLTTFHWLLFLRFTWVPMVLPAVGFIVSSIATVAYDNYRVQKEQKLLAQRAEEQEQAILMLRMSMARRSQPETTVQAPTPIQTQGLLADRYKIKQVLASGGFGVTYVAQDQQRPGAPECVVKQLRPTVQDPQFLQVARRLFKTEAEILEIVGRHDRIPQLLAYFEEGQDFYLVEELIQGSPLGDRLPLDRRLSDRVVFKLLRELLPTLSFIHDRHIIHRDIKPNNIIHRPADDALVLIDFGAVKQIQPNLSEIEADKTIAIGTQGYAAPEQLAGHPRLNSDIYSLGVIAIRALTGVPPHLMDQDPNTGDLAWQRYAKCHRGLAKVVHRMARYHFAERYATADEALRDLLALL